MSRKSNIVYDPKLSVKDNAAKNNVSVAGIYYYLRSQNLDKNQDKASGIVKEIQKVLKENSTLSQAKVAKELGRSVTTVNKYWKVATGEKKLVSTKEARAEARANTVEHQTISRIAPRVFEDILKAEPFSENVRLTFDANTILAGYISVGGHNIIASIDKKADVLGCPTILDFTVESLKRLMKESCEKVALLLPLSVLSDTGKYTKVFKAFPPSKVYAYTSSIGEGADVLGYAWYVWNKKAQSETVFGWIGSSTKKGKAKNDSHRKDAATAEPQPIDSSRFASKIICSDSYAYFYMDVPLSNWWASPMIEYDGHSFISSEAVFMYQKAKAFGDMDAAMKIVEVDNDTSRPEKERFGAVKKLGKQAKGFDEDIYQSEREDWMLNALRAKYYADPDFSELLTSPEYEGKTFVEASPWDGVWGIKKRATKAVVEGGPSTWNGLNLLGKALTKLRDEVLGKDAAVKTSSIRCDYDSDNVVYSLCGGVFGDIVGSTRERSSKSIYNTDFELFPARSRVTDDSILTVAIADWLLHPEETTLSNALRGWGRKYPNAGFGGGFKAYVETGVEYCSDKNGAAMRVSPVAIAASTLEETLALAKESAILTHNSEEGIKGAQAIAAAIYLVRNGVRNHKDAVSIKSEVKSYIEGAFGYDLNQSIESIRERSKRFVEMKKRFRETGIPNPEFRQMSDAAISCPMAIIAFLEGNSYEEVLRIAISMGGDADTVGCMASSISAHLYGIPTGLYKDGRKRIPQEMMAILDEFDAKYFTKNSKKI